MMMGTQIRGTAAASLALALLIACSSSGSDRSGIPAGLPASESWSQPQSASPSNAGPAQTGGRPAYCGDLLTESVRLNQRARQTGSRQDAAASNALRRRWREECPTRGGGACTPEERAGYAQAAAGVRNDAANSRSLVLRGQLLDTAADFERLCR